MLKAGLALAPKNAYLLREWARCLFRTAKPEAKAAWLATIKVIPEDFEAYASYFQAMERLGQAEEGMAQFRKWAQEHPDNAFFQAMAYRSLEKRSPEEAQGFLEKAIALDPEHELVLTVQGEAAFRLRKMDVVAEVLASLGRIQSSDQWMIRSGKFDAMVHQKVPEGLEKLLLYNRLHPLDPNGWSALATTYMLSNDLLRAEDAAESALRWHPYHSEALFARGYVATQEERFADAIIDFEKSLKLEPGTPVTLRNLAECYQEIGQHEQAKQALREAEALASQASPLDGLHAVRKDTGEVVVKDPTISRAEQLCQLGALLTEEGKLEEAREHFRQATKLAPTLVEPHLRLAVLEQMGYRNLEGAIDHWEQALAVHPTDGSVHALGFTVKRLALAYHRQGEREKAWKVLDTFVRQEDEVIGSAHPRWRDALAKPSDPKNVVRLENIAATHCVIDDYCLSQSIATILDYWKLSTDVEEIGNFIGEQKYGATALNYLDTRSKEVGYRLFTPKLDVVKTLIEQGFPVMLLGQFLSNGETYGGHATVVVGYDETLDHVLIEDSNWFRVLDTLPFAELEEFRAFVIAPNDKLATLEVALPDEVYHRKLMAIEPLIAEKDASIDMAEVKAMIALQPKHWWGHFVQGMAYRDKGMTFEAELAFTKAAEMSTKNALPFLMLTDIHRGEGWEEEVRGCIRRALERQPNLHAARKQLIVQLFDPEGKRQSFMDKLKFVVTKGGGNRLDLEEALRECKRYLNDHPDDLQFLPIRVACELKLGRYVEAEQTARTLMLQSGNLQMPLWLALSLYHQGKVPEALDCIDSALKQVNDDTSKAYFMKWKKEFSKKAKRE